MKPWIRRIVLGVAVSAITLVLASAALLNSRAGLVLAVQEGLALVPGEATVERVEGDLLGPFSLHGLRWSDGGSTVRLAKVEVDWHPWELLAGRVRTDRLDLDGLTVSLAAEEEEPETFPWPTIPALAQPGNLPVSLDLRRVRLRTVVVSSGGGQDTVLDELSFAARSEDGAIRLSDLRARSPMGSVQGELVLGLGGEATSRGRLDWRSRVEGRDWAGVTRVRGRWDELVTDTALQEPVRADLRTELHDLSEAPVVLATIQTEGLDLRDLDGRLPASALGVRLELEFDAQHLRLQGRVRDAERLPDGVGLRLGLRPDRGAEASRWTVSRLSLRPGTGGSLELTGSLAPSPDRPDIHLEGGWEDMVIPLPERDLRSGRGDLRLDLDTESLRVELEGGVTGPAGEAGGLSARVRYPWTEGAGEARAELRVSQLDVPGFLSVVEAELLAQGTTDAYTGELMARGLDVDGLPGTDTVMDVDASIHGGRDSLTLDSLTGRVGGQPLEGSGSIRRVEDGIGIEALRLKLGGNSLAVDGRIADTLELDWDLDAPAIETLGTGLAGRLSSAGRINGPRDDPSVDLRVEAEALRWQGRRLDSLTGNVDGTRSDHRLRFSVRAPEGEVDLAGRGGIEEGAWRGRITSADLRPADLTGWELTAATTLRATRHGVELGQACLTGAPGLVCIQGRVDGLPDEPRWRSRIRLQAMDLGAVAGHIPEGWLLSGRLSGELRLEGETLPRTGTGELTLEKVRLAKAWEDEPLDVIADASGRIGLDLQPESLRVETMLGYARGGRLEGHLRLPRDGLEPVRDRPLEGRITATVPDLGFASLFSRELGRVRGSAEIGLALAGDLAEPLIDGDVRVRDAAASIPRLGIRLTDISARTHLDRRGAELELRATSGEGNLTITATTDLTAQPLSARIRVQGQDATAVDLPEAEVRASPDLEIALEGRRVDVTGALGIPYARISPPEGRGVVEASPDEVIVGDEERAPEPRYAYHGDVRLTLGDDVRFSGLGLDAGIRGSVRVVDQPRAATTATGQLDVVDGRYRALGQELTIRRGRLIYNGGPLENPGLDIRAVRESGEITAGVEVRGSLRRPRLDVFSDPTMPQSDAVSFLMTGKPLSQLRQDEQGAVNQARDNLALQGGAMLAEQLGRRLGVGDLSVETGAAREDTAVFLGRYLSPRLYVSYGVGVFESFNAVRLRYQISEHLSLQTESGREDAADLMYTIERGLPDDD